MLRLSCLVLPKEVACRRNFANQPKSNKVETHYDVLNVRSDCSTRDIRNAFVKLSKQYHPDMKSNVANSANFVKISEAYHILVKPQTRKEYDRNLSWVATNDRVEQDSAPWEVRPNYTTNPGPYYGIKGLNRVSNLKVALFLLAVGIFGAIFGFGSVRHSFELNRQIQDEMSAEAISHHAAVVADAQKYGNEEQVRRMVERLSKDPYNQAISK